MVQLINILDQKGWTKVTTTQKFTAYRKGYFQIILKKRVGWIGHYKMPCLSLGATMRFTLKEIPAMLTDIEVINPHIAFTTGDNFKALFKDIVLTKRV